MNSSKDSRRLEMICSLKNKCFFQREFKLKDYSTKNQNFTEKVWILLRSKLKERLLWNYTMEFWQIFLWGNTVIRVSKLSRRNTRQWKECTNKFLPIKLLMRINLIKWLRGSWSWILIRNNSKAKSEVLKSLFWIFNSSKNNLRRKFRNPNWRVRGH